MCAFALDARTTVWQQPVITAIPFKGSLSLNSYWFLFIFLATSYIFIPLDYSCTCSDEAIILHPTFLLLFTSGTKVTKMKARTFDLLYIVVSSAHKKENMICNCFCKVFLLPFSLSPRLLQCRLSLLFQIHASLQFRWPYFSPFHIKFSDCSFNYISLILFLPFKHSLLILRRTYSQHSFWISSLISFRVASSAAERHRERSGIGVRSGCRSDGARAAPPPPLLQAALDGCDRSKQMLCELAGWCH